MNHRFFFFSTAAAFALFAAPLAAWADANPDFDDDAKPILRMQPGLLEYVRSSFEIKDTGTAKFPGDDDHAPRPPFIFRARPMGSSGPFNLRLLIQPGPPGHILGVADITKIHLTTPPAPSAPPVPAVASQPSVQQQGAPPVSQPTAPQTAPAPTPVPAEPNSDTPSGPINSNGQVTPLPPQPSSAQSLAPPPDPAPAPQ
jgi:hypothetical protein